MSKAPATSPRPLRAKLGMKDSDTVLLLDVPGDVLTKLVPIPDTTHVKISRNTVYDVILAVVETPDALAELFGTLEGQLAKTGGLWVAWKKQRKGFKPSFGFYEVQQAGLEAGLVDVKVCSVSDVWSGLKFIFRVIDR